MYTQVHDKEIKKCCDYFCGADIWSAALENDMHIFVDEVLQLQILQVTKYFTKSKQRSDTSRFYRL